MHIRIDQDYCRRLTEFLAGAATSPDRWVRAEAKRLRKGLPDFDKDAVLFLKAETLVRGSVSSVTAKGVWVERVEPGSMRWWWGRIGNDEAVNRKPFQAANAVVALAIAIEKSERQRG